MRDMPIAAQRVGDGEYAALTPTGLMRLSTRAPDRIEVRSFGASTNAHAMTAVGRRAVISLGDRVELWDTLSMKRLATLVDRTGLSVAPQLALSDDERVAAVGACPGPPVGTPCGYLFFDATTGTPSGTIPVAPDALSSLRFSDTGAYLVSTSPVEFIVYSVAERRPVLRRAAGRGGAGSPDNLLMVSSHAAAWANPDGLEFITLPSGRSLRSVRWPRESDDLRKRYTVWFAALGARNLVAFGADSLTVWDVQRGEAVATAAVARRPAHTASTLTVAESSGLIHLSADRDYVAQWNGKDLDVTPWASQLDPLRTIAGRYLVLSQASQCLLMAPNGASTQVARSLCDATPLDANERIAVHEGRVSLFRSDGLTPIQAWGIGESEDNSSLQPRVLVRGRTLGVHAPGSGEITWLSSSPPPKFPKRGEVDDQWSAHFLETDSMRFRAYKSWGLGSTITGHRLDGSRVWFEDIGGVLDSPFMMMDGDHIALTITSGFSLCQVGKACRAVKRRGAEVRGVAWPWLLVQEPGHGYLLNAETDASEELPAVCRSTLAMARYSDGIRYLCRTAADDEVALVDASRRAVLRLIKLPFSPAAYHPTLMLPDALLFPEARGDNVAHTFATTLDGAEAFTILGDGKGALVKHAKHAKHADGIVQRFGDASRLEPALRCVQEGALLPWEACGRNRERRVW